MSRIFFFLSALCWAAPVAAFAQTAIFAAADTRPGLRIIWIVDSSGKLNGYAATDFRMLMGNAPIPRAIQKHPENIMAIRQADLVMYLGGDSQIRFWSLRTDGEPPNLPWETRSVTELALPPANTEAAPNGATLATEFEAPQLAFSADGQSLFWFQNRMHMQEQDVGNEVARTAEFLCWTTDLDGRNARPLAQFTFPKCDCGGACDDSCPRGKVWTPPGGVSSFFYLTRFIPGQTESKEVETDLYQNAGAGWKTRKLEVPVSRLLDARDNGNTYIEAIPDGGCCGWENESDDLTYLVRNGQRATLFDEYARFHNQDYDVSFSTEVAEFSPDGAEIAYSITATSKAGQPIRLADGRKKNPEELRQIQASLLTLPLVEVLAAGNLQNPRVNLPITELIGWAGVHRLLVWRDGQLFVVDTTSGQLAPTGLKAEKAADVILE